MSLVRELGRPGIGVVECLEISGLDPAFVTPVEMADLGLGYSKVPGERGQRSEDPQEEFIPVEQLTKDDLKFWMACI